MVYQDWLEDVLKAALTFKKVAMFDKDHVTTVFSMRGSHLGDLEEQLGLRKGVLEEWLQDQEEQDAAREE